MDKILTEIEKTAKLISLPETYLKLKAILDEPDFAMAEVAVLISQDPGLTVRILRLVNSSFFARAAKIQSVSQAVSVLGTQQIHDLVLATSVAEAFEGMSSEIMTMPRFWKRSVQCGVNARLLSAPGNRNLGEHLFVCGLLHDIGHLIMYQSLPGQCQQAMFQSQESGRPLYAIERHLLGFDSAKLGGSMMRRWELPASLWEPVQYHVAPEKAKEFLLEASFVHIASLLSRASDNEGIFDEGALVVDPTAWEVTNLTTEQCLRIQEEADLQVRELMVLIFT